MFDEFAVVRRRTRAGGHDESSAPLFDDVEIRESGDDGGQWHDLQPGTITTPAGCLIREYSLPADAMHLSGQEALIHVSFRSIKPSASCDYTATFPWLCDGFTIGLAVQGQPRYLLYSSGMRGTATIQSIRQHQTKIECSSTDLILPGSVLVQIAR